MCSCLSYRVKSLHTVYRPFWLSLFVSCTEDLQIVFVKSLIWNTDQEYTLNTHLFVTIKDILAHFTSVGKDSLSCASQSSRLFRRLVPHFSFVLTQTVKGLAVSHSRGPPPQIQPSTCPRPAYSQSSPSDTPFVPSYAVQKRHAITSFSTFSSHQHLHLVALRIRPSTEVSGAACISDVRATLAINISTSTFAHSSRETQPKTFAAIWAYGKNSSRSQREGSVA